MDGSVTGFFQQVCTGDGDAVRPLWDRYFPRLMRVASQTLSGAKQRAATAEDAVQSAFICFWQQAVDGKFSDDIHRDDVWALLSVMTVRKARKQIRREVAKKRGGDWKRSQAEVEAAPQTANPQAACNSLTPDEFDLFSEELLMMLDEGLRSFAVLKLMGHSNAESAQIMECTERTVERKLRLIRQTWEMLVVED